MDENGLQYTLGAGTLLGAMRNAPPGLLQWEHDVDVYVLARQASLLLRKLQAHYPLPALPRFAPPAAPRSAPCRATPHTWSALRRTGLPARTRGAARPAVHCCPLHAACGAH